MLTVATVGAAKEGRRQRDRRYILLHPSFPFLAGASMTSYLTKTGISPAL